jgi:hypothetical protein
MTTDDRAERVVEAVRPRPDPRAERVFRQAVAHEMLQARQHGRAPTLDPDDPRWRLASETALALQGTVLPFEDRRRLLALAQRLGIRAFDANLIVAVVQDRARRGEPIATGAATIAMVPRPQQESGDSARFWIAAVVAAMAIDAILVAWLMFS